MNVRRRGIVVSVFFLFFGLNSLYSQRISIAPGPEDMVLDTFSGNLRLLISCSARREEGNAHDGLYSLDIETGRIQKLIRRNEPKGWQPRFHGIDLVQGEDGMLRLYAISHGLYEGDKRNLILIYKIENTECILQDTLVQPEFLKSPNDICATADGRIFVSNDYGYSFTSFIRYFLSIPSCKVVQNKNGEWSVAAKGFRYANGLKVDRDFLYVATTKSGRLYRIPLLNEGVFGKKEKFGKRLKGLDNISMTEDHIWVCGHPKPFRFFGHKSDSAKKSPVRVWAFSKETGEESCVYRNEGLEISAASTAIYFKQALWLCQVFDGFILRKELRFE